MIVSVLIPPPSSSVPTWASSSALSGLPSASVLASEPTSRIVMPSAEMTPPLPALLAASEVPLFDCRAPVNAQPAPATISIAPASTAATILVTSMAVGVRRRRGAFGSFAGVRRRWAGWPTTRRSAAARTRRARPPVRRRTARTGWCCAGWSEYVGSFAVGGLVWDQRPGAAPPAAADTARPDIRARSGTRPGSQRSRVVAGDTTVRQVTRADKPDQVTRADRADWAARAAAAAGRPVLAADRRQRTPGHSDRNGGVPAADPSDPSSSLHCLSHRSLPWQMSVAAQGPVGRAVAVTRFVR